MKLIDELNAEEGSFLLELRTDLNWNHDSFINLITELYNEYKRTKKESKLSREIASGIWYTNDLIKNLITQKAFPQKYSSEYYKKSLDLINDLTYSYFMSESPYQYEDEIENKINVLHKWL